MQKKLKKERRVRKLIKKNMSKPETWHISGTIKRKEK
jgi:hypothetical protein